MTLTAPTSYNDKGTFSYYNAKDKKVVTFTNAAAYFEYKELCEEMENLDKNLVSNIAHNALDAIGVIPGVGEIADAINGCVYLAEGDLGNAGLSFVSCIPLAGDALGKGTKAVGTVSDTVKTTSNLVDAGSDLVKHGDELIETGGNLLSKGDEVAEFIGDSTRYGDGNFSSEQLELLESGNEVVKNIDNGLNSPKNNNVVVEYSSHGDADEFARQLKEQQDGLNSMTAGEIKANIDNYRANGRPAEANTAIKEFRATNDVPSGNDVTHGPDMSIGGNADAITGYGDSGVNRSIGRQNGYRQDAIYDAVSNVDPDSYVHFEFVVK